MRRNASGFTLVEVLVAMVVIAIGLLGVQMMQIRSVDDNASAGGVSEKSMGAAARIERIINLTFKKTKSTNVNDAPPDLQDLDGDGTNQDVNGDGIDDSDDGNVNTVFVNEGFGLRHNECCPGNVDPRRVAVAGCTEVADHCIFATDSAGVANPEYNEKFWVYWNVADDFPATDMKTINIIVVNQNDRQTGRIQTAVNNRREMPNRAEYTFSKAPTI